MLNAFSFLVMNLMISSRLTREDWESLDLGSECSIINNNYNELCAICFPLNSFSFPVYRKGEIMFFFNHNYNSKSCKKKKSYKIILFSCQFVRS